MLNPFIGKSMKREKNTGNKPVWLVCKNIIYQSFSLVSYSRRFGNYRNERRKHERIKKGQDVFIIIIVQNIKIEISIQKISS